MDQVSKPVLIGLAAVVFLLAAKFTVLKPKTDSAATPAVATAPGTAGLGRAVDKANTAVAQSQASATRSEQAAATASGEANGGTAAPSTSSAAKATATPAAKAPAAPVAAKPKPAPKLEAGDRSGPILRQLAAGKVVVAVFYNRAGADDHAALRAARAVNRHHGRVIVRTIPIQNVGDFNALTTDVEVLQAPTIMVIGPKLKARTIVGYTEVKEVDQMVGDVGGSKFRARPAVHLTGFAAKASAICQDNGFGIETDGTPTDAASLQQTFAHAVKLEKHSRSRVAAVGATGAKQRAAKHALLAAFDTDVAAISTANAKLKSGAAPGPVLVTLLRTEVGLVKQHRPALRAVHERHCLG